MLKRVIVTGIFFVIVCCALALYLEAQVPQTKFSLPGMQWTIMGRYTEGADSLKTHGVFRLAPYDTLTATGVPTGTLDFSGRNNTLVMSANMTISRIVNVQPGTIYYLISTATTDTIKKANNLNISANFVGTATFATLTLIAKDTNLCELSRSAN